MQVPSLCVSRLAFCASLVALACLGCTDAERSWGVVDAQNQDVETSHDPAAAAPEPANGFTEIAAVLQSPRCRNCHPAGDAPLQTDRARPHAMNITRLSAASGLECEACHQASNIEAGGIPGAPHWGLPPVDTPMVFEGLHPDALCRALRDPSQNGGRSLADLLAHVRDDPLVRWGWAPGGGRSVPPLSHAQFVEVFAAWVAAGGPCVGDPAPSSDLAPALAPALD
jgi:hypothetical protein